MNSFTFDLLKNKHNKITNETPGNPYNNDYKK